MQRILVTGGAGFIGSNLCEHFLELGYKVRCVDNFLTGRKSNIEGLLSHANFEFLEGDILDVDFMSTVLLDVDIVSHQAALGSVPRSIANPVRTNEINAHGFLNVLTLAKDAGVKRFVYASSSSVYGDSQKSPKIEEELGKPLSPYAVSKLTNELYGRVFNQLYGMETIGLRYFNVFGKNQDPNGVYAAAIPKFIQLFLDGEAPTIFGDGSQTRDFTYIKNVIHANQCAVESINQEAFGEAFNVACGDSFDLNEVVNILKSNLISIDKRIEEIQPIYVDVRKGDIKDSLANISKIKNLLNYKVQLNFAEGMKEYIKVMSVKNIDQN
ncbi:NAD-dependent epimerase/dehydratase family protein [Crocinitomix catalasitica]|uniref:NAD-dependent epimerase/dehydratase family protein n=1 Tax=Crocinitomix catalasitica TaxID=184607 RepID=UPI0004829EB4|nr:NAD-dependent epimerase/dehydratase family protein [Crocinitomix catalasitica]